MGKNLLVTLADENYVDQAKQLFSSAHHNGGWDDDYMLLSYNVPEDKLKWFREKGVVVRKSKALYSEKKWYSMLPKGVLSPIVSCKYELFRPEFKKWDIIIYLDSDMIVRSSLDELKRVKGFGAVEGFNGKQLRHELAENNEIFDKIEGEIDTGKKVFNAGMFVINTGIIEEETFNQLRKTFEDCSRIALASEQTILNLSFYGKWEKLPPVYNFYILNGHNPRRIKPKNIRAIILHFLGADKPWKKGNNFYDEWKSNFDKAHSLDPKKIIPGTKWSKKMVFFYSKYLDMRMNLFNFPSSTISSIDRTIGLFGLKVKRKSPRLYLFLRRIKNV